MNWSDVGSERNLQRSVLFHRSRKPVVRHTALRMRRRSRPFSVRPAPSITDAAAAARRAAISCGGTMSSSSSSSSSSAASCSASRRRLSAVALDQAGTATGADWWYGWERGCLSRRAAAGMAALGERLSSSAMSDDRPAPPDGKAREERGQRWLPPDGDGVGEGDEAVEAEEKEGDDDQTTSRSSSSSSWSAAPASSGCLMKPRKRSDGDTAEARRSRMDIGVLVLDRSVGARVRWPASGH
uniref:Uncharacterized protein n=1 Tax=Triticum urartu TaxID=4572 RepID=A0A8R7PI75_TRIUA